MHNIPYIPALGCDAVPVGCCAPSVVGGLDEILPVESVEPGASVVDPTISQHHELRTQLQLHTM